MTTTKKRSILFGALETLENDGTTPEQAAKVLMILGVPRSEVSEVVRLRAKVDRYKNELLKTTPTKKQIRSVAA